MKSKKLIIGNWKMNPRNVAEAKRIFSALQRIAKNFKKTQIVVCPPFVYLPFMAKRHEAAPQVILGAQNMFFEESGAYTGEISPEMIKDFGVHYVILGHSERRLLGETDEIISKKVQVALHNKLIPVICIGESNRDQEGKFFEFIRNQIRIAFSKVKKPDLQNIVIAYEPVWAIGKAESEYMKGAELYETSIFIRKTLSDLYGKKEAWLPKIIYGGSVAPFNVADIIFEGHVDGILPGRASLEPEKIKEILNILEYNKEIDSKKS